MKILITTPFFGNLGGSELETIHTANAFASFAKVKKIDLFVDGKINLDFKEGIFLNKKISIIKMPSFYRNRFVKRINKTYKKLLKLEEYPGDKLFWKLKFLRKYDNIYIITKTSQDYYVPIIKNFKNKNKIIVKYTTIFYNQIPSYILKYLALIRENLVTSKKQEDFFKNHLKLSNTSTQEVIIYNEQYALNKKRKVKNNCLYDFGILGRFYREKQFEDAIQLIAQLKDLGYISTLLIRGDGMEDYYVELKNLIISLNLEDLVKMEFEHVPYDEIYDFFDRINCFLITSKYEGGPNIGLEVMAYGLPILSYDVGAMSDRLGESKEYIALDKRDLLKKAIKMHNYNDFEFETTCNNFKTKYLENYSNSNKISYLNNFLEV